MKEIYNAAHEIAAKIQTPDGHINIDKLSEVVAQIFENFDQLNDKLTKLNNRVAELEKEKVNIQKLYSNVFDEYDDVKACGREKCISLINALSNMYPDIDFGNKETGQMNIKNIKKYII